MDFAAILADTNTFADNIEMAIGNEKVTLGQLRELSKREQQKLADQMGVLQKERDEVKELAVKAADLLSKAQPLAAATETRPNVQNQTNPEDYWDTDPLYEPVRKRFTPLEKQLKEAMDTVKAQQSALEKAALIFARDRWDRQYERMSDRLKGDKYKDWKSVDKLAEYAAKNQLVDAFGMPSIERAITELTKEDDLERIRREAKEAGIEEGKRMARMATMTRPTSAAGQRSGKQPKTLDPTKNFEDLGDAVAEDADLMEMISAVQGLDPNSLQ